MTPEALRGERIAEATRRYAADKRSLLEHLMDIYETNWTPPEPEVDPDLVAAISYAKIAIDDDGGFINTIAKNAYLAGCTRGREGVKGLVEALEKQVYVMSQSHGDGARLSIGFLTTNEANDAHEAVARLTSAKRGG